MKTFEEIWVDLRKDIDFKIVTFSEGSAPYEDCKEACEMVYNAVLDAQARENLDKALSCGWAGVDE